MRQADELITSLGITLGIEGAQFDEYGCCTLIFDDIPVEIDTDDGDVVALSTILAELKPEESTIDVYESLLQGNFFQLGTCGATLGFDPGSRVVSLVQR